VSKRSSPGRAPERLSRRQHRALTPPRVALTIVALLLFGAFASIGRWSSLALGTGGQLVFGSPGRPVVIPNIVIWLAPIVTAGLLLLLPRDGRRLLRQVGRSRAGTAVAVAAVIGFLFTLYPQKETGRLMVAYVDLGATALMFLLAAGYPLLARLLALLRPALRFLIYRLRPAPFVLSASGVVLALTNLFSWRLFRHIPHVHDSISQFLQARIFAAGHVTVPARFDDFFFHYDLVVNDGSRIWSQFPFVHPLLLAPGMLFRAEWLVNPLLGAAEIVVLYFLGRELYDERTGRLAALLGAVSPFLLFMSSEYMNHASGLLFLSLFALFFFRTIRPLRGISAPSRLADPLLCGLSLAIALNIRPLSAVGVSVPFALYAAYLLLRFRWRTAPAFLVLLVLVLLGISATGIYNRLTTGNALLSSYDVYGMLEYGNRAGVLGFGNRGFPDWGAHTPLRGLIQTGNNLNALNLYLFQSPLPGLLLVLLLFVAFTRNPADWVLLASFAALPALYFFYWFQDLCFGPRYLYEGLAAVLLLSARAFVEFPRFMGRAAGAEAEARTRNLLAIGVGLSLAAAAFIGVPRLMKTYGDRYWGVDDRLYARVTERGLSNAVVFVGNAPTDRFLNYYGAGLPHNALDFAGPVVYARNRGVWNYLLMLRFPGRAFYYADRDTFFQLTDTAGLRNTPPLRDLQQAGQYIRQRGVSGYRCILLPFREAGALVDTMNTPCQTFREAGYHLLRGTSRPADFLPAVAVFILRDPRTYAPLFEPLREGGDYVRDGVRFTVLFRAEGGTSVVYDVRPDASSGR
jgi:4-amino-4-deoxy-L-arabinose transferase-like glycosyltransferase